MVIELIPAAQLLLDNLIAKGIPEISAGILAAKEIVEWGPAIAEVRAVYDGDAGGLDPFARDDIKHPFARACL